MPNSRGARCTVRYTAAVSSSSLAGMQPTFRQVPPSLPFSMRAMLRPADAPYSAVAYPPGPPPMTTTSKVSAVGTTSSM